METLPTGGLDTAPAGSVATTQKPPPDTLTLQATGSEFTGWKTIRVTHRLEGCPSDFEIAMSERYPLNPKVLQIDAGDPCVVKIDNDVVVTGYIDRVILGASPREHTIRVQGRGKCQDLVDCSITPEVLTGMQVFTSSLLDLATKLAAPYGITVSSLTGDKVPVQLPNGAILQFNAVLTETPYEVIERVARWAGVLGYEGTDGNFILANVGAGKMASGVKMGVNIQQGAVMFSMDERYSEYLPVLQSVNFYDGAVGGQQFAKVFDKGVPRFRNLVVVSEQSQFGTFFAERRAQWEAARRLGRSRSVHVTVDSWRDSANALWAVNYFAPVDLPQLKLSPSEPFVIGQVDFAIDRDRGKVAELLLMPKEAFLPEPIILQPFPWDPTAQPQPAGGAALPPGENPNNGDRGPGLG